VSSGSARQRPAAPLAWTPRLTIENDFVAGTDRNYTQGLQFSVNTAGLDGFADPRLADWLLHVNRTLRLLRPATPDPCTVSARQGVFLGQQIYTPVDWQATAVLKEQRPYAAWLYGGVNFSVRERLRLQRVAVSIGVVGPAALGEQAQNVVHERGGWAKFRGWDNQLSNEPTLQLLWERKRKWRQASSARGWGSDLIAHGGVSLGNVATYLNGGAELRYGWHLPDDFGSALLRPGADNGAPRNDGNSGAQSGRRGGHLFAAVDGRWVLRDIFLDGNTFSASHRVDKEPLVADLALGAALEVGELALSYTQIWRTREFATQSRAQVYGSLSLSWARLF